MHRDGPGIPSGRSSASCASTLSARPKVSDIPCNSATIAALRSGHCLLPPSSLCVLSLSDRELFGDQTLKAADGEGPWHLQWRPVAAAAALTQLPVPCRSRRAGLLATAAPSTCLPLNSGMPAAQAAVVCCRCTGAVASGAWQPAMGSGVQREVAPHPAGHLFEHYNNATRPCCQAAMAAACSSTTLCLAGWR